MLEYQPIDGLFRALAEPARRAIVERLSAGPASVSDLAAPLPMSLAAVVQHVQALEEAGVVTTQKVGRVRTCSLAPNAFDAVFDWLTKHRLRIEQRFDRLGDVLDELYPDDSKDKDQ